MVVTVSCEVPPLLLLLLMLLVGVSPLWGGGK